MLTSKVAAFTGFASVILFSTGCGVVEDAPPRAPDAVMPKGIEMPSKAPEAGKTRVVVDANGDKATVDEVTAWSQGTAWGGAGFVSGHAETVKPLCIAPCVVDLEPGVHVLRFTDDRDRDRHGEARFQVGERPKLIRHAMGRTTFHSGAEVTSIFLMVLGASAAATGGTMLGLAAASPDEHNDVVLASAITLGVGATMLLFGIPMAVASQPHMQEGSTTEKTLDR